MDRRHQPRKPKVGQASEDNQIFHNDLYHYRIVADGKPITEGKLLKQN